MGASATAVSFGAHGTKRWQSPPNPQTKVAGPVAAWLLDHDDMHLLLSALDHDAGG